MRGFFIWGSEKVSQISCTSSSAKKRSIIKQVIHTKGKSVYVESFPFAKVEVDGEAVGFTPVTVTMMPHALRIVVP